MSILPPAIIAGNEPVYGQPALVKIHAPSKISIVRLRRGARSFFQGSRRFIPGRGQECHSDVGNTCIGIT